MRASKKTTAVGAILIASLRLEEKRGGKQKLQKILGEEVFYKSPNGKFWFYNTKKLFSMTLAKLKKLNEQIQKS